MKIIYLHQYFNTPKMSGGTRSYEMAKRLVNWGHEVHIVTSDRQPDSQSRFWRETNEAGIHVHWCPVKYDNTFTFWKRINAFFLFAGKAALKAAALDGDLIFASSTPLTIALPAMYAAKRKHLPMVFEVRDLWPQLPIAVGALRNPACICAAQFLEKAAYKASAHVVALSPGMKTGIIQRSYPAEKVSVIPNSCDVEFFDVPVEYGKEFRMKYAWLAQRPLVVYVGTFGLINGVGYLARLAKAVLAINPEIRFLLVGKGRETDTVRQLAQELDIFNRNFFMLPPIIKKDVPAVLSAADIAMSTVIDIKETWNNSANKFFDALASGTPIAINHEGWQADILRQSGAGIVLDIHNIQQAAEDLVSALHDSGWLQRASRAARILAKERFSRDLLAKQLEQVLLEAIRQNSIH